MDELKVKATIYQGCLLVVSEYDKKEISNIDWSTLETTLIQMLDPKQNITKVVFERVQAEGKG